MKNAYNRMTELGATVDLYFTCTHLDVQDLERSDLMKIQPLTFHFMYSIFFAAGGVAHVVQLHVSLVGAWTREPRRQS